LLIDIYANSMKTMLPSVCALDCPDACALQITVEDGRVTELHGDREHPFTRGFACVKTARYPERQEHPDRLTQPMKRVGKKGSGQFEAIGWDEALDSIAHKLTQIVEQHGPESVLPYCYSGTLGVRESNQPLAFFRAIGAAELDQTICAATAGAGWEANYGPNKVAPDPEDVVNADFILLWGINSLRSNSHLTPILRDARKRGATIVHIDPYRNETSRFADEHIALGVGTDAALALAIGNWLIEHDQIDAEYLSQFASGLDEYCRACSEWPMERAARYCGISEAQIESLARRFGQAKCSFIRTGYGMTRNEGGGNAMRAITLLPALTGAWKNLGGGAALSTSGAFGLNQVQLSGRHLIRSGTRHVNMNQLATDLSSSESLTHAFVVFNSNPAVVAPDSSRVRAGLERPDLFTVVLEHFQTDTADFADFLLPATTFLEHPDLYAAYGHYYLQWAEPVVPPRGESRPNSWIFAELAKRMGLEPPEIYWDAETVARSALDSNSSMLTGITLERLREERSIKLKLPKPFLPYSTGSHFADKKIRFSPPPRQIEFEVQLGEEFPFRLISPPGSHILNSTFGNVESLQRLAGGEPLILMNSDDAEPLGIGHGERVRVTSEQGFIDRKVLVGNDAVPGVVVALGQWWNKLSPDGKGLNEITSERLTDLGGGSTFGNPAVRVEKISIS
jgi:anaerobic selenocysteine-containing dehydrogenase